MVLTCLPAKIENSLVKSLSHNTTGRWSTSITAIVSFQAAKLLNINSINCKLQTDEFLKRSSEYQKKV